MKKSVLFVSMLAAGLTFTACSNDDSVLDKASEKQACTFKLTLPSSMAMQTKAVEDPTSDGESISVDYNDATCYLNYSTSRLRYAWAQEADKTDRVMIFKDLTEVPQSVTVVANDKGSLAFEGYTRDGQNIALDETLFLKNLSIASQNQGVSDENDSQSVEDVTLFGTSDAFTKVSDATNDDNAEYAATVNLGALVARFEVGTLKAGTGLSSLTVDSVFVNNFYETSAMKTLFYKTSTTFDDAVLNDYSTDAFDWASLVASDEVVNGSKCYAWQLFAGNEDDATVVPHFIFEVSGTLEDGYALSDGTIGSFTKHYVTFGGLVVDNKSLEMITRQNVYQIGDYTVDATQDITPHPEMPKLNLTVTCTVKSWGIVKATPVVQ